MLSNYLVACCALIALLNGAIALFAIQFSVEASRLKGSLIAIVAILSLAAIFSANYGLGDKRRRARHRRDIVVQLGDFLQQGTGLLQRVRRESETSPDLDAERWNVVATNYIEKNLGISFVHRFVDPSGIPIGSSSLQSEERRAIEDRIQTRLARLQQFIDELEMDRAW
jgi:hypothetical protein